MKIKTPAEYGKVLGDFLLDKIVTILFVVCVVAGFCLCPGITFNFFINDLAARFFRNGFLVLSLIIPVIAGLGMNFGIVVGAIAGMLAIIIVRFIGVGGLPGILLCALIALPLAILFGIATGKLYNNTRGQEMIASLIVGYFASGLYQFIGLFVIGVIIPVAASHPLVQPGGIGLNATIDMGVHPTRIKNPALQTPGLTYALDWIWRVPFVPALITVASCMLCYLVIRYVMAKRDPASDGVKTWTFVLKCFICAALVAVGVYGLAVPDSILSQVRELPAVTGAVIVILCLFINYFTKTKLGQDCRSVGQSQHIAKISGIDVDRTRIIATVISTVLASWGMIIYLQNMGTLSTFTAHQQIGLFSVASLLVGGATTSKANVKNALIGIILFNSMAIVSTEIGVLFFPGNTGVGEFFRSFTVYGVIGLALGLYVWKDRKAAENKEAPGS